jgi:hypothetical protein
MRKSTYLRFFIIMRKFFGGFFRNSAKKMVKPIQKAPSMPINAGKRLSGGMTSATRMPTQLSATRAGARSLAAKPKKMIATPNASAFKRSKFAPGQRMTKRRSSAGFSSFANLVNFIIHK